MNNGYACLLQELTGGGRCIGYHGADQPQTGELPIGFPSDLAPVAQEPCRCAVLRQGHGQRSFFFAVGEKTSLRDAVDAQECLVGPILSDMVFGHFPMNGLPFRVEFSADEIDGYLAVLQFMDHRERVGDHADLFILYKGAKVKDGATAIEEDDFAVVDGCGSAAGDGLFCFDVDGRLVGERKGWVGWGWFVWVLMGVGCGGTSFV